MLNCKWLENAKVYLHRKCCASSNNNIKGIDMQRGQWGEAEGAYRKDTYAATLNFLLLVKEIENDK